jgi:hypothetical protein
LWRKKSPPESLVKRAAWTTGFCVNESGSDEVGGHGCYEEEGGRQERQYLADACYFHFEYLLETFRKTAPETRPYWPPPVFPADQSAYRYRYDCHYHRHIGYHFPNSKVLHLSPPYRIVRHVHDSIMHTKN